MLNPVGPLAPAVYWRRRLAAVAVLVAAVALVVTLVLAVFDGGDGGSAAGETPSTATSPATSSAAPLTSSAPATASSAPVVTSPATGTSPTPPAAPAACQDAQLQVVASATNNVFAVGDKPKLSLSVVNAGGEPCVRDLDAATQEILIFDADGTRRWSSNDCYPGTSVDTRVLAPGEKVEFSLLWSGKVSEPGCAGPRPLLGAGDYWLEAHQGAVVSGRTPFSLY
ncbi:MucR family transcriptional regulator [Cumulibacter manganitolerans]|uniref:MucR family transcriptional regulator n=1 Tax=Cumulibacter manganitolerans TaxID=1884992 RepID=UPI0012956D9E|nr:MucR family transcriptional regulator [Cumulibacter manganitolerans]